MNNQENKLLKDYTDQEIINEITERINNFSLDLNCLIYPLALIGSQYLNWYKQAKKNSQENNQPINLKFKYNFLTKQLWKLKDEYAHRIEENTRFYTPQENSSEVWQLSEKESLFFTFATPNLRVGYQKEQVVYQKLLEIPPNGEIIFEFTEQDRITHEKT